MRTVAPLGLASIVALSIAAQPAARAAERVPVLVELFTSQGCSSCPPADELLRELSAGQPVAGARIVPLSLHVDYWNRLGWADPYSDAAFSARQMLYADADGRRYTPQMVVDGGRQFVGTSRPKAIKAIRDAAARGKRALEIEADLLGDGRLRLAVSGERLGAGDGELLVHLAVTRSELRNAIPRGENAGRDSAHVAVVRHLATLGAVRGDSFAGETSILLDDPLEVLTAVAFAQETGGDRRVLALGTLSLAPLEKPVP